MSKSKTDTSTESLDDTKTISRLKEIADRLEKWLERTYDVYRRRSIEPPLKRKYAPIFRPTLVELDKICDYLEQTHPNIPKPIRRKCKMVSDCLSETDGFLSKYDFQTARQKLDSLVHYIWRLIETLQMSANNLQKPTAARGEETNLPDYRAVNLAKRIVTIGAKPYAITSEKVWDFLKDLWSASKDDRIVPMLEGSTNNKNAVDQLRNQMGKNNLRKLIIFIKKGGYKLNPEVKISGGGQIGIRKTHLKKNTSDT